MGVITGGYIIEGAIPREAGPGGGGGPPSGPAGGDLAGNYPDPTLSAAVNARFTTLQINTQSGTAYTLQLSDAGKMVEFTNAAAVTVTIPSNAAVAFPVGTTLSLLQVGAGALTVAIAADTLRAPNGTRAAKQFSLLSLTKRSATEWILSGDTYAPSGLSSISGLSIQYKPDPATMFSDNMVTPIIPSVGNSIQGWQDQSGGNRHAYQPGGGLAPVFQTNIQNGLPMAKFDGTSQFLPIAAISALLTGSDIPFSAMISFRQVNTAAQQALFCVASSASNNPNTYLYCDTAQGYKVSRRDDGNTAAPVNAGVLDTSFHIAQVVFSGTACSLWVDGVQIVTAGAMDVGTLTLNTGCLGALLRNSPTIQYFNGWIGSFALWNKALSAAETAQAFAYERSFWGV